MRIAIKYIDYSPFERRDYEREYGILIIGPAAILKTINCRAWVFNITSWYNFMGKKKLSRSTWGLIFLSNHFKIEEITP